MLGLFFGKWPRYAAPMATLLRPATPDEHAALSDLCLRSKAYWGYERSFLEACRSELSVRPGDDVIVAERDGILAGMAQITLTAEVADLEKLFVDPPFIGLGLGRHLFERCASEARRMGVNRLTIEADPGAVQFYEAMGAIRVGTAPSASIPGRMLPLLEYRIR